MTERRTCPFCLAQHSLELRYDRRARPYFCCTLCFTRAFIRNLDGVRGMGIVPELIDRALETRQRDEDFKQFFDAKVIAIVQEVKANGVSAPSRETPMGLPDQVLPIPFATGDVAQSKRG